ncbi:hypothetical protein [Faecalibacillus intestinalis]|uniref:hypothetical protein n=1 Tax=Faecalibacillus intestinalis TaxID=1982626 RepID=UPI0018AA8EC9|nr:hypothetical protein [Faecalibacillus intestinalis]
MKLIASFFSSLLQIFRKQTKFFIIYFCLLNIAIKTSNLTVIVLCFVLFAIMNIENKS